MTFMGWNPYQQLMANVMNYYCCHVFLFMHPTVLLLGIQHTSLLRGSIDMIQYIYKCLLQLFKTVVKVCSVLLILLQQNQISWCCCLSLKEKQHYFYPKAQCMSSHINIFLTQMLRFTEQLKAALDTASQVI